MARILVYTPTFTDEALGVGLQAETVESVKALDFDGDLEWVVSDENPHPGRDMKNVQHQFEKGRGLAIEGDYDALMLIEHDMIVPPHAVQALWDTDAPVVYGSYVFRHKLGWVNLFQYVGKNNIGMSLTLYPKDMQWARQAGEIEVSGAGFGCLLLKRTVFTNIPFRDTGNAPDLPFAYDCVTRGIKQMGRTDVECGHIDTDNNNVILWPYREGFGIVARVEAMQSVNVNDEGQTLRMVKGERYSMSIGAAKDLERAGYARIINEDDIEVAKGGYNNVAMSTRRETAAAPEQEIAGKLDAMTVPQLRELAGAWAVDLTGITLKADIIAAIEETEK